MGVRSYKNRTVLVAFIGMPTADIIVIRPSGRPMRIHITGASGSGTTTLGKALADQLGGVFLDADDFFWSPSEPPYRSKRSAQERLSLLLAELSHSAVTVLSGSVDGWGAEIEDAFDGVVFLYLDTALRLHRLRVRELQRFGEVNPAFIEWAAQYDDGPPEGRSLARQRTWLSKRSCPVLYMEDDLSTVDRLTRVNLWIKGKLAAPADDLRIGHPQTANLK